MTIRISLLCSVLTTLLMVHIVSIEFHLYWKYLWLDIPMHILGGVAIVLGVSILPFFGIRLAKRYTTFFWYLVSVVIIGIAWEFFEIAIGFSIIEPGFIPDTITDLSMDVVGAVLGYGLLQSSNVVES